MFKDILQIIGILFDTELTRVPNISMTLDGVRKRLHVS